MGAWLERKKGVIPISIECKSCWKDTEKGCSFSGPIDLFLILRKRSCLM
jgi:hypothetical protein